MTLWYLEPIFQILDKFHDIYVVFFYIFCHLHVFYPERKYLETISGPKNGMEDLHLKGFVLKAEKLKRLKNTIEYLKQYKSNSNTMFKNLNFPVFLK